MSVKPFRKNAAAVAVLFVKADWCPHCKVAKPEVRRAAEILGSVVPVYEVDSERDAGVIEAMGVEGFPTIFFRNVRGKLVEYRGQKRARDIADWVCTQSSRCGV